MAGAPYSHWMLSRARRARTGVCFICGPTPPRSGLWVEGTSARLCAEHTEVELRQALAALAVADRNQEAADVR